MPTPLKYTIVLAIQSTLQGIAVAAGYYNTVKPTSVVIDAFPLNTVGITETPWVVIGADQPPGVTDTTTSKPNLERETFTINLWSCIDALGSDYARKLRALMQFEADIEVAVMQGLNTGGKLFGGGLAMYALPGQSTYAMGMGDQNRCVLTTPINILLRRQIGVPSV